MAMAAFALSKLFQTSTAMDQWSRRGVGLSPGPQECPDIAVNRQDKVGSRSTGGHYGADSSFRVSLRADLADTICWNVVVDSHELRARIIEFARWTLATGPLLIDQRDYAMLNGIY
jgi:hypothetical protein